MTNARRVDAAGYNGDYLERINGQIPEEFTELGSKVEETHRLFQAALNEYLKYWDDEMLAHLESGSRTFKQSVLLTNEAIADITREMQALN